MSVQTTRPGDRIRVAGRTPDGDLVLHVPTELEEQILDRLGKATR
jgi:hypothetical protein